MVLVLAGHALAQPAAAPATPAPAPTNAAPSAEATKPWRLTTALGLPGWLDISGEQRTRYETLDGQFRRGLSGSDQGLFFRTRVKVTAKKDNLEGTLEVRNSRAR